jgi:hypothetical protein
MNFRIQLWLLFGLFLLAGCSIPINDFFGENITTFTQATLYAKFNCMSGKCPEINIPYAPVEKDCWFCRKALIEGSTLNIRSDGDKFLMNYTGCYKNYTTNIMDSFEIISQNETILVARGETIDKISKINTGCESGCDKRCEEPEYSYTLVRGVELVFEK